MSETMPAVRIRGLTRHFGEFVAVDGLDLDVPQGEILGFLGPNGAGKTTSIRMLAGLMRPTSGTVEVLGRVVGAHDPVGRRLIGVCPQENVLYPELTARENLEFAGSLFDVPRKERRERADRLLALLGLSDKKDERAGRLSGGMKRRLTLALALVHDPPVVVLDEPEAGLDPQTRVVVREFIRGLKRDRTVILTSHNMDEVDRLADRVAIVDQGKLVAVGTPDALKSGMGSGDHLEITLADGKAPDVHAALAAALPFDVRREERIVIVRGLDVARSFPAIVERVRASGGEIVDVRYRGNTLEDVFISLTGRGLRE